MLTAEGRIAADVHNAALLGERLARELLAKGAKELIADVRRVGQEVAAP
jgi:ribosomal protein L18